MKNQENEKLVGANRNYKDAFFKKVFGNEKYKGNALSLFNTVMGSNYDNPNDIDIVTLENVLLLKVMNDVALISNDSLCLFEQQSTWNENMPLRLLVYLAREYEKYINSNRLNAYRMRKIMIPNPKLVCFYNGTENRPAKEVLKLSDAFIMNSYNTQRNVEAMVVVYNLNVEQPELNGCKELMEYGWFVNKVNEYKEKCDILDLAIDNTLNEVPQDFILRDLLLEERGELMSILKTEFNQEEYGQARHEDGYEEGIEEGIELGLAEGAKQEKIATIERQLKKNKPIEEIADIVDLPVEQVEEIIKKLG